MPTHKLANSFIKKYNKDLQIKGYSALPINQKLKLIEEKLKTLKMDNVNSLKNEWSDITGSYKTKIESNEKKREKEKKSKEKNSLWTDYKNILDKNKSKLQKNKTPVKGKDIKNAYDYYNLLYSNRNKLKPNKYLKSLKDEVKNRGSM